MSVKKVLLGIGALSVLAIGVGAVVLWRLDARGRAAVAEMCALDGGPTVTETVFAGGVLDETETTGSCLFCEGALGRGAFDFTDFEARFSGPYVSEPGYYRMTLSAIGDPACAAYLSAKERMPYLRVPADFGREPNECYAVAHLPARPEGYVYSSSFRRTPAPNGHVVGVVEQFIRHEPSGRVLAVNRDYLYTSITSRYLDMSGGGGITDATCPTAQGWRASDTTMMIDVLRDEGKR